MEDMKLIPWTGPYKDIEWLLTPWEPSGDPRPTPEDCKCRKGARCLKCMEEGAHKRQAPAEAEA